MNHEKNSETSNTTGQSPRTLPRENKNSEGDSVLEADQPEVLEARSRRVSFPKCASQLVTGYLEPANPWESVSIVQTVSELCDLYKKSCRKHNTEPLKPVLDHLQSLELSKSMRQSCLKLKKTSLTPDSCEALEEVLKRVQYEVIDVSECELNDTSASALFDMIEYYEAASELDISDNPDITSRGLQSCISMIRRSRALQIITIRGTPLSEANASNLGKSLNSSFLHTIKLEHCGLTGRPITALCNSLKKNNTLKELWLAHNDLNSSDAERLADLLKSNGYLEFLDISNNSIKDLGVRLIVKALIEQSSYIEDTSTKLAHESLDFLNDSTRERQNVLTKSSNGGRSMLDTLLSMKTTKFPTADYHKIKDDDGWDFGQSEPLSSKEDGKAVENISLSISGDVEKKAEEPTKPVMLEKQETESVVDLKSGLLNANNNEYATYVENEAAQFRNEQTERQTKALDFNQNKHIEIETGSDSAFESASEGDNRFKDTLKINKYSLREQPAELYTKDSLVGSASMSDSGVIFSDSRRISLSSESLSSENSLDTSDSNMLDKINEKITKNDTLTRQKHIEEPVQSTKRPKGLQALILWNNNITRESGEYISDLLATTVSLELLNIGKNILSNDFIAKIEESLRTNSTLTNFGLQSAHLSCAGIKILSTILQFGGNCTLERIDIRDNNLQVEGLSALAEALKSNKSVTRVDVDDVPKRVSDDASDMQFHYSRVLHTLRSLCCRNGNSKESATLTNNVKKVGQYLTSRKISLTCPSIRTPMLEPALKVDQLTVDVKKKSNVRLRSPLPSPPTASPTSSPFPSPSRSRFQVFRVIENKSPSIAENTSMQKDNSKFPNIFKLSTTDSNSPQKEKGTKFPNTLKSRFHVTLVKTTDSLSTSTAKENNSVDQNRTVDAQTELAASTRVAKDTLPPVKSQSDSQLLGDIAAVLSKVEHSEADNSKEVSLAESAEVGKQSSSISEDTLNTLASVLKSNDSVPVSTPCTESVGSADLTKSEHSADLNVGEGKLNEDKNEASISTCNMPEIQGDENKSETGISVTDMPKIQIDVMRCETGLSSVNMPEIIYESNPYEKSDPQQIEVKEIQEITPSSLGGDSLSSETTSPEESSSLDSTKTSSSPSDSEINEGPRNGQLCDNVPASRPELCKTDTEPRVRKMSWISTTSCPSTVDKLLSLFQNPAHIFARTASPEQERKSDESDVNSQSLVSLRKQSPPGIFSWHKAPSEAKITDVKRLSSENIISSNFQSSFLDVASKQIRGIADFGKQVFRQNIAFGETLTPETSQSCDSIPTEVKLEIKENISPEHTITPNSIAFLQPIQQGAKTTPDRPPPQGDTEECSQNFSQQELEFNELVASECFGNNM